jgi:hypothetical protein
MAALQLTISWMPVVFAAEKHYDIELVVFENLVRNDQGEVWPMDYLESDETNFPQLEEQEEVIWLSNDQRQLNAHHQALRNSSGFRPLAWYAWRQPVLDRNFAQVMALPATGSESNAPYIDGTVRVSLGRYLHLDLDLQLHTRSRLEDFSAESGIKPRIHLSEQRRMRSRELHYFDHPRFGAIALITPANAAEIAAESDKQAAPTDTTP